MYKQKTVPCTCCKRPTTMVNTKLCDNCWEAIQGVDYLMTFKEGRDYINKQVRLWKEE